MTEKRPPIVNTGPADHLAGALQRLYEVPPENEGIELAENDNQIITGRRAKSGFGIASGRTSDPKINKYGGSTIKRQVAVLHAMATGVIPHLSDAEREHAANMRDYLLEHIPNKDVPGTINIETDLFMILARPTHEISFMWTKHILPFEKFYYVDAQLTHTNPRRDMETTYDAMLYIPAPDTKGNAGGESHISNRVEAMVKEWMDDIQENDPLRVTVAKNTFIVMPAPTVRDDTALALQRARSKGVLPKRPKMRFNELSSEQKAIYRAVSRVQNEWPKLAA